MRTATRNALLPNVTKVAKPHKQLMKLKAFKSTTQRFLELMMNTEVCSYYNHLKRD